MKKVTKFVYLRSPQVIIPVVILFLVVSLLAPLGGISTIQAAAGTAVFFNQPDRYVTFGQALNLGVQTFTIETWIIKTNNNGNTISTGAGGITALPLVTKGRDEGTDGSNTDVAFFLGINSSGVLVADFEECNPATMPGCPVGSTAGANHPAQGATVIANGTWYHVAVTYDGRYWKFYVNGVQDGTTTDVGATRYPRWDSIQHAALGVALDSAGVEAGNFRGTMDEVRIWNVARTAQEIQQNMYMELTSGSGLISRWGMNEGSGSTINNSIAGYPNGTLMPHVGWAAGFPIELGNHAPVAVDDTYSTAEDTALTVVAPGVLGNDTDQDTNPLTAIKVTDPTSGTLTLGSNGSILYTPALDATGDVTFTYKANDGLADSNTATVTITITPVNDAPVLGAIGNKSVDEETQLTFTATATDIDSANLTYSLVGAPSGALINDTTGVFTWTPTEVQGTGGTYSFDVCVSDGFLSDCETIVVTVNEVNVAPVLGAIGNKTAVADEAFTFTASATDADRPDNTLTFSLVGAPSGALINGSSGVFTWTPTQVQQGDQTFTVKVCDNGGLCDEKSITITVLEPLALLNLTLKQSLVGGPWTDVFGTLPNYRMALNGKPDNENGFEFIDVQLLAFNRVPKTMLHPFYLDITGLPPSFYTYWSGKGVTASSPVDSQEGWLWQIITGKKPMFYLKVGVSPSYMLVDGFMLDYYKTEQNLQVSGDYPWLTYTFTGEVTGQLDETLTVSVHITFEDLPKVTALTLKQSLNPLTKPWTAVYGTLASYRMALNGDPAAFEFLDVNSLDTNKPLKEGLHPFYLNQIGLPTGFMGYWDAKDVKLGTLEPWKAHMYQIITGVEPMFYLKVSAGSPYMLVDGLMLDYYKTEQNLQVSGDYPLGMYTFDGMLTDQIGESAPFSATITFEALPQITALALKESVSKVTWNPLPGTLGGGYQMALDALQEFQYIDVASLTATRALKVGDHAFYLNTTVLPADFYTYWDGKGVNSGAAADSIQGWLWQIINGKKPMFYLKVSAGPGPTYKLVDGFMLDYLKTEEFLRVDGTYPVGTYTFSGVVTDMIHEKAAVTVSITFSRLNHAPVADPQTLSTNEDVPLPITLTATDADNNPLTWIVDSPSHGVLSGTAPNLTYTPTANWSGSDSFTFKVNDGLVNSSLVTVSITVVAQNDAPVAVADAYQTNNDQVLNVLSPTVLSNDTDVESNPLTAVLVSTTAHGNLVFNANGTFKYTPAFHWSGVDSFTYKANDGSADSNIVTVTITVKKVTWWIYLPVITK